MQQIQIMAKFVQENLAVFSFCVSLTALAIALGSFRISRKSFLASHYPKIRANLYLHSRDTLPWCSVYNESDKITANDLRIEISIRSLSKLGVFKSEWFRYSQEKLERLRPLENFMPSGLSADDLIQWLKERGHQSESLSIPLSLERQRKYSRISLKKSYTARLSIYYTSNLVSAKKVFKISKKYKLISCSNSQARDPEDEFYWKLVE